MTPAEAKTDVFESILREVPQPVIGLVSYGLLVSGLTPAAAALLAPAP
jgi:hypothetical protein